MITIVDPKRFPASEAWKSKCKMVAEVLLSKNTERKQIKIKEVHLCDHVQMFIPPLLPHLEANETDHHKLTTLFKSKDRIFITQIPICAEYIEGFIELSEYENEVFKWKCTANISVKFTLFYSCEGTILELQTYHFDRINPIGPKTKNQERFLLRLRTGGWL